MPLLMCPNCNDAMKALNRKEVEFDMCPSCRGVWLDRGELEKLMDAAREEAAEAGRGGDRGDWRERGGFDRKRGRGRGFDFFDIFD